MLKIPDFSLAPRLHKQAGLGLLWRSLLRETFCKKLKRVPQLCVNRLIWTLFLHDRISIPVHWYQGPYGRPSPFWHDRSLRCALRRSHLKHLQRQPNRTGRFKYSSSKLGRVLLVYSIKVNTYPFTAMDHSYKQPPRWPTFLAMLFQILKEGMGLWSWDELKVKYHVIKSNEFQTYDGAKVTVWKQKPRRRHRLCSRSDAARRNFYKPIDWTQEATMVKVTIFFLRVLSSVWLLFYQSFDTALLLWSSPDSRLAMFHSRQCSYIRTDYPLTKARRAFTVSWNIKFFVHSSSVVIFFPGVPRHQFPLPANLHRHSSPSLSTRRNQL